MKRFLLFVGCRYYPNGGWEDFQGSFDTVEGAELFAITVRGDTRGDDWFHVVDGIEGKILMSKLLRRSWETKKEE